MYVQKVFFFLKKKSNTCTKILIYVQNFKKNLKETVLKKYIYFSFKNVYIFLVIIICWLPFFFLKNDQFFLNDFISYFISRKFLFSLVFLFFNEVKTFTVQGGSQMKFFLKTKVEITTVSSESQNKLYECVIFFIFDILDFLFDIGI